MSTLTLAVRDSSTMVRRQLKRLLRYPSMTVQLVVTPVILLLLFVYVLGGTLGSGLGGGRDTYVNYVVPGILLMAAATAATGTAVMVATDMTEGIIARFRTMRISRASVLSTPAPPPSNGWPPSACSPCSSSPSPGSRWRSA
ncbi:ABC transporter permease [Actinomadura madurae]|uniref:ABC transporter permease n=1 Tax=Actinomadura madurae TaxID=1993 RepID=UPI003D6BDD5A